MSFKDNAKVRVSKKLLKILMKKYLHNTSCRYLDACLQDFFCPLLSEAGGMLVGRVEEMQLVEARGSTKSMLNEL